MVNTLTLTRTNLNDLLARYHHGETRAAWVAILNSFIPFFLCFLSALKGLDYSYLLSLTFTVLSSCFLVRIFGIQHDCGHGSFFKSRWANDILGRFCSVFTLTPYDYWLRSHAYHHAHVGNLNYRETGYVTVKTVKEYLSMGKWGKLAYRLYQHPIVLLGIGPTLKFVVLQRLTSQMPTDWLKERKNVHVTNIAIVLLIAGMIVWVGVTNFLLVYIPIVVLTASIGVWIFYVQHMFEDTYWQWNDKWDYITACLATSSYYKIPRLLHWIAFYNTIHHIHHLDSRIPSYRLEQCYLDNPELQEVRKISVWESLKFATLGLWDEEQNKLISFSELQHYDLIRKPLLEGSAEQQGA